MDFRGNQGRPQRSTTPARQQQSPQQTHPAAQSVSYEQNPKKRWLLPLIAVLALAILVGAVTWHVMKGAGVAPRGDRYQAVFLDDNQVFFGNLKNTDGKYLRLENAYSTRATDLPEDATAAQKEAVANNVSLVKVGDLVYGPENVIMIRAEKVRFWQDLKDDSKVAKAIDNAK